MATQSTESPRHPVAALVDAMTELLDEAQDLPVWSMDQDETAATLKTLTTLVTRTTALEVKVAGHAQSVAVQEPSAGASTGAWWAAQTRQLRRVAKKKLWLAGAMTDTLAQALGAGEVLLEQAEVIVHALEALPADLDATVRAKAEQMLIAEAAHLDAISLKAYGRGILAHLDPEAADAHENAQLVKEEAAALAAARLTYARDGHGKVHGRFTLPEATFDSFEKYLLALAAPARHRGDEDYKGLPGPHKLGLALVELIERYPADALPEAGGLNASVMVVMDYETLLGGVKACTLDTGLKISAGKARQILCEAGVIPMVLGGTSEVLDVGHEGRFHTKAMRRAKRAVHATCQTEGCDIPSGLCQMHHLTWWSRGGKTRAEDSALLCTFHHQRAHDHGYRMQISPAGNVTFTRRQ